MISTLTYNLLPYTALFRPLDLAEFLSAWLAVRECPMWTGAIAIRRDTLFDAGLFPEGRAVRGGDKDLWLRVLAKGSLRYDPRVTARFHRDSDNKVSRSEEHTSELQSLLRNSYADFCLKKKQ